MTDKTAFSGYTFLIALLVFMMGGCSFSRLAVDQTAEIMIKAMPVYERETNIEFAERSIAGAIKQIEGLLEVSPDNPELLLLASRSYATYAFGFVEERIDIADKNYDFEEKERLVTQAVDFYSRSTDYGLRLLRRLSPGTPDLQQVKLERLDLELKRCEKRHVPGLFWTAFSWGSIINLLQSQPSRLAELPKVDLMMQRVLELDERYYYGGPHMFYGVYYGGRPEMLGGDPEKAKFHFERAIVISEGRYLMTRFLLAKYYAVRVQDRELFMSILSEISKTPDGLFPEQGLANQLAKRNAARWLTYVDEVFFGLPAVSTVGMVSPILDLLSNQRQIRRGQTGMSPDYQASCESK